MKQYLFGGIACALCVTALVFADDVQEPDGSAGLDRMLQQAHIGTTFSDFVMAHPEAVYSDAALREAAVAADRPGALLITHDTDPFLGLNAFANIGFRDGLLYELVAVWTGAEDDVATRRRRFFTATIQRHGQTYVREAILVHPHTAEEHPAAVFLWREADTTVLAFYTAPSPIAPRPLATLTYAQFMSDDPFLDDILSKHPPSDAQRAEAWQAHEDILPWLETLD